MCRLLGIVASEPTEFGLVLTRAPRCLATLSREHPDGWGIAVHHDDVSPDGTVDSGSEPPLSGSSGSCERATEAPSDGAGTEASVPATVTGDARDTRGARDPWRLHKGIAQACEDARFHEIAEGSRGHVLIAHIRQKTVGPTRLENTHPFARDGWVFAHNGTLHNLAPLHRGTSAERLAEVAGDTDSELLFAYLLTRLDREGLLHLRSEAARDAASALVESVASELRALEVGAFNFLLSDGVTSFAHRSGRSLFILERTPCDPVRESRPVDSATALVTKWSPRRHAVFVASERVTDEPWRELPDGSFLRIERLPTPRIVSGDRTERAA